MIFNKTYVMTSFLLFTFLLFSTLARAQFYPGYMPYYGGCFKGCSTSDKIATGIGLGLGAMNSGLYLHDVYKDQQARTRQYQIQAEALRSSPYNPQAAQDYYNMQLVAPFFDDGIPGVPSKSKTSKSAPKVDPFTFDSPELKTSK